MVPGKHLFDRSVGQKAPVGFEVLQGLLHQFKYIRDVTLLFKDLKFHELLLLAILALALLEEGQTKVRVVLVRYQFKHRQDQVEVGHEGLRQLVTLLYYLLDHPKSAHAYLVVKRAEVIFQRENERPDCLEKPLDRGLLYDLLQSSLGQETHGFCLLAEALDKNRHEKLKVQLFYRCQPLDSPSPVWSSFVFIAAFHVDGARKVAVVVLSLQLSRCNEVLGLKNPSRPRWASPVHRSYKLLSRTLG